MIELILFWLLGLLGAVIADAFVRPRPKGLMRSWPGLWVLALCSSTVFGTTLAMFGHPALAALLTAGLNAAVAMASNAKRRVLGEPLLFSDLALVGAMLKHPQFYFSVLALWQQIAAMVAIALVGAILIWLADPSLRLAALGLGLTVSALVGLALSFRLAPWRDRWTAPAVHEDVSALGLVPTILAYWRQWRRARQALAAQAREAPGLEGERDGAAADGHELIVVVQCESFADPEKVFATGGVPLPQLKKAQSESAQWGRLEVSGFGAYTMRTEYGVLFGREESELGFLLYDPYLTALIDPARALPQKLGADRWRGVFVHPHDMRFYGRDAILPKAGFAALVGEDHFDKPKPGEGRYVSDAEVAEKILEVAKGASQPTLIYAVTMENHGPWAPRGDASTASMVDNYNRHVLAGDAMLGRLREGLAELGRPVTLVFFGDHRPTIPGASDPGGDRHTPYVILKTGAAEKTSEERSERRDLTPAQLHQAILDWGARP